MTQKIINLYGDQRIATRTGNGVDVASQRMDDLDAMALGYIRAFGGKKAVMALDVGCGHGGQTARMAKAGACVVAMDSHNSREEVADLLSREGIPRGRCFFFRAGVERQPDIGPFDIVMCQRMIHYLPHQAAGEALAWFHRVSVPEGRLFLSASGLDSELGKGYSAKDTPVEHRFTYLSSEMSLKHSILLPVCLYRPEELVDLATQAGWIVEKVFTSPFGNVKLVARKPLQEHDYDRCA